MPIYEYRCQDCNHEFELMQKFSDPAVETCPSCAGTVQKLISRSAFHLKGTGWYVTDYARNGTDEKKADKSATKSDPDSGSTPSAKPSESSATTSESASTTNGSASTTGGSATTQSSTSASKVAAA